MSLNVSDDFIKSYLNKKRKKENDWTVSDGFLESINGYEDDDIAPVSESAMAELLAKHNAAREVIEYGKKRAEEEKKSKKKKKEKEKEATDEEKPEWMGNLNYRFEGDPAKVAMTRPATEKEMLGTSTWGEKVDEVTKLILSGGDPDYVQTDKLLRMISTQQGNIANDWTKKGNAELQGYYNTVVIAKNRDILSKTQMDGQNHSVLKEMEIISGLEGDEKEKRKEAVLKKMEELGMDAGNYALYTDDSNFNWSDFGNFTKNNLMEGLNSWNQGIFTTLDNTIGKGLEWLGWENNPVSMARDYYDELYDSYRQSADFYKERLGGGTVLQGADDFLTGTGGALPDALLAIATLGASTAPSTASLSKNAVMQSGTWLQKAGLKASSVLKNPRYWLSYTRTWGQDYEEAKAQGASDVKASLGATITSLINAGIENGVDGTSGIQGLPQELAQGGGNAFKTWFFSGLEEMGEEPLQKAVNEITTKVLYNHDAEIFDPKEYAYESLMGGLVGWGLGGGQTAIGTGINAYQQHEANKLSVDEQTVYDKVVEELIAEKEKDGKKLTAAEKRTIKKDARRALEDGTITVDMIEKVLGGESYNSFREAWDNFSATEDYKAFKKAEAEEAALRREYNELREKGTTNLAEMARFNDLHQMMKDMKTNSKKKALENKLLPEATRLLQMRNTMRGEVINRVSNSRLAESYRELERSKQKFTVDVNKYTNENARTTVQAILDSGLGDNSNAFHNTVDFWAKLSADHGLTIKTVDNKMLEGTKHYKEGYVTNGFRIGDEIVVNMDSPKVLNTTVGHELTHVFEVAGNYNQLSKVAIDYFVAKEGLDKFNARLKEAEEIYKGDKNTTPEKEVVADIIGEYLFTDYDFIQHLAKTDRNGFLRIWDEIKYFAKIATAGSKEAREFERLKREFERAYKENIKGKETEDVEQNSYSRPNLNKDEWAIVNRRKYSEFDNPKFDLDNDTKWMYANEKGTTVFAIYSKHDAEDPTVLYGSSGQKAVTDYETLNSYFRGELNVEHSRTKSNRRTLNAILADINSKKGNEGAGLPIATGRGSAIGNVQLPFTESRGDGRGNFGDGAQVNQVINSTEYNNEASENSGASFITFSNDYATIRNFMKEGDTGETEAQYSMSKDSQGKELTVEQSKFFKDSKAVDELGNLVRVYHGTRNADFTVFKRNATYFTDNKDMADSYSPNGDMYEGYVNITKPFEIDAEGEKWSRIPIDEGMKEFLERYGSSVFEEDGSWRTSPADIVSAIEEAIEEGEMDYDGIIIRNVDDTGSYYKSKDNHLATDYITFNSNQFKNVDNVKPTANPDIRYSMTKAEKTKMDKDYLDAVTKNDQETLQHLVGEYAKASMPETKLLDENGNPRVVYHGTNTGDFTVFNPDYIGMSSGDDGFFGMGFYFAYSKGEASYYGAKRIIPAYLDIKNPFNFDKELRTYNGKKAMSGYAPDAVALMNFADKFPEIAKDMTLGVAMKNSSTGKEISLDEFSKAFKDVIENKHFEYEETVNDYGEKETIVTADPEVHSYEYNGETHTYRDFGFQKRWYGTPNEYDVAYEYLSNAVYSYIDMPRMTNIILDNNREFTATLKEMGYDGTIQSEYGDEAVAFDPSQIKSAELITYDDNGDVIPLSKRFDKSNDDIRYSMSKISEQINAYQYNLDNGDLLGAEMAIEEIANLSMPDSKIRGEDGKLIPVYHGTNAMFWEFAPTIDGGKNGTAEGFGIYLSDNQEVTNAYGDRQMKMFANITKPATAFDKTISSSTLTKLIKQTCEREAKRMVDEDGYDSIEEAIRDTWISNYVDTYDMSINQAYRTVAHDILQAQENDKDIVHEVMFGMAIRSYEQAMDFYHNSLTPVTGIDGFITKWSNENTGETSNIYLAFDSSQLKSADAVTKDDNGNVIPVTERFNFDKGDIRYSMSNIGEESNGIIRERGTDFGYHDPLEEFDIAPVMEDTKSYAPKTETVETSVDVPEDDYREAFEAITDEDVPPVMEDNSVPKEITTVEERLQQKIKNTEAELEKNRQYREQALKDYDEEIALVQEKLESKRNQDSKIAQNLRRRIERLTRLRADINADYSKRISDLENRLGKMNSPEYKTSEQRRAKMQEHTDFWEATLGDTSTWKDMALGLAYKTKTLRRILRHVVKDANGKPDYAKADAIYDALETKYDHNEALLKRESQKLKEKFFELNLNHTEDTYAHMLGELRYNPQTTLTEDVVKEYYKKHKSKIDTAKVNNAINEARKTFDDLIVRVNEVLKEQGMKEIPYRKGYFPHFTNPKQGWLAKLLNWKTVDNEIPTSIAGLTETFDPQRSWQGFNKERKGDKTDYSLYQGLDTYIHGALDWIYHIDDLQSRRSLENYIRYIHSEEGVKAKIDEIKANEYLDADQTQVAIDAVLAEAKNPLNNLVTELRARTNTLANKKASMDRGMEEATNRKIYSTMTNLNNRINANMVVGSFSSALTNFIPMVQSWHQVSPWFTVRGLGDMIRSTIKDDGMVARSDFLTNRLVEEEKLYQTGWDKVSDKAAFMMNAIDSITSQTVWRSKYLQNIKEGMSESGAIKDADQFAKNLLAGRSRGNMPTIFDAKNPLIKMFTSFQLEVANQYGYMFDDTPKDVKNKARLVKGYATALLGAYAYNALYSAIVGRDSALDPIGIIEDFLRDLFDDDDEEENVPDALMGLGENIVQEVPFVGGFFGGGRVPVSSALPYNGYSTPIESMMTDVSEGNWDNFGKEFLKPLYYLAMPVGGGQLKKTVEGLSMFDDDLPITGSYTSSGKLRFPVEKNVGNVIKAGLFGQYASKNAREYFDNDYAPLGEKQIKEYIKSDIPISDYWEYRKGLRGLSKLDEKADYIDSLDLPISTKNLFINNIADRKERIDMTSYGDYSDFEEFDYAQKNPGKYAVSKAVTSDFDEYQQYSDDLNDIRADKDKNGKTISGSAKQKKADYINSLNIPYEAKLVLFKKEYPADDTYNNEILAYVNSLDYITFDEKLALMRELGFTVRDDGFVSWD